MRGMSFVRHERQDRNNVLVLCDLNEGEHRQVSKRINNGCVNEACTFLRDGQKQCIWMLAKDRNNCIRCHWTPDEHFLHVQLSHLLQCRRPISDLCQKVQKTVVKCTKLLMECYELWVACLKFGIMSSNNSTQNNEKPRKRSQKIQSFEESLKDLDNIDLPGCSSRQSPSVVVVDIRRNYLASYDGDNDDVDNEYVCDEREQSTSALSDEWELEPENRDALLLNLRDIESQFPASHPEETEWTQRKRVLEENWTSARNYLFDAFLSTKSIPEDAMCCTKCKENVAVIRCTKCRKMLCSSCDETEHIVFPIHDRDTWINGFYEPVGNLVTINEGEIVLIGDYNVLDSLDPILRAFFNFGNEELEIHRTFNKSVSYRLAFTSVTAFTCKFPFARNWPVGRSKIGCGFSDLASSYSDIDVVEEEQSGYEVGDVLGQNAWTRDLTDTNCLEFQEETGPMFQLNPQEEREIDIFEKIFTIALLQFKVKETNRNAHEKFRDNEQRLRLWEDVNEIELLSVQYGKMSMKLNRDMIAFSKGKKGVQEVVEKPAVICLYNAYMISIDLSDQFQSYYPLGRTGHRWYKYIFWFLFDVSVGNAMVLWNEFQPQETNQRRSSLKFCQSLAMQMIGGYCGRKSAMKRNISYNRCDPGTIREQAKYGYFICEIEGRKKECIQCKRLDRKTPKRRPRETFWKCSHCDIPLCKDNCFLKYHSYQTFFY
eukprot:gene11125-20006_t